MTTPKDVLVQDIRMKGFETILISWATTNRERGFFECLAPVFDAAIAQLEPMRRAMVLDYFGARNPQAQRKRTYKEVGDDYGVSRQRAHQLVSEGCQQLLKALWDTPSNGETNGGR